MDRTVILFFGVLFVVMGLVLRYWQGKVHKQELLLDEERNARAAESVKNALDQLKKDASDAETKYHNLRNSSDLNGRDGE